MTKIIIVAALAFGVASIIAIDRRRVAVAQENARVAALEALNAAAARDSTRDLASSNRAVAELLGDSLRVAQRAVVQASQRADALDKALASERVAAYSMSITVDSLRQSTRGAALGVTSAETRHATFDMQQPPYRVHASVELPPPPDSGTLHLDVAMEPVVFEARVSCGSQVTAGVRAAAIELRTPRWMSVQFGHVEQSLDVCSRNAIPPPPRGHLVEFRRLIVGVGFLRPVNSQLTLGAFVGAGVAIGY